MSDVVAGPAPVGRRPDDDVAVTTATPRPARPRVAFGRLVLLVGGAVGLVAGIVTGLSRAGLLDAGALAQHHGVLLTLGFFGTLIALERAVAARQRWVYVTPAVSTLAVVALVAGAPAALSGALFAAAGSLATIVYVRLWRTAREHYLAVMGVGGVAWTVSAVLWAIGSSPVRLTPFLASFLILTIIGERLELSRLRMPGRAAFRRMLAATAIFCGGVALSWFDHPSGLVVAGIGSLAVTAWFVRHDIARVTIRKPGLPRFAATCMLAGYAWLAVGGALWVALGLRVGGPLLYDAAVHAVFVGFVLSMVMGHAPIILPAVLRIELPYRPIMWLPLVLLHTTLSVRVTADLFGSTWGRGLSAASNAAVLVLFVAVSIAIAVHARRHPASTTVPSLVPPRTPSTH